ncbi:MAG: hypothetical protein WCI39_13610, partial [Gallionellaceae bacterium]
NVIKLGRGKAAFNKQIQGSRRQLGRAGLFAPLAKWGFCVLCFKHGEIITDRRVSNVIEGATAVNEDEVNGCKFLTAQIDLIRCARNHGNITFWV